MGGFESIFINLFISAAIYTPDITKQPKTSLESIKKVHQDLAMVRH